MNDSEPFKRASAAALRYLAYRPRSESEVRKRLMGRFPPDIVEGVIDGLAQRGLADDTRFAELWADSRNRLNPRSASAIRRELVSKGVARDIAECAVREVDDQDAAYSAGSKHARRLSEADSTTFRRRLWGYLRRRGFSSSVSRGTIDRLWDERQESADDPESPDGR